MTTRNPACRYWAISVRGSSTTKASDSVISSTILSTGMSNSRAVFTMNVTKEASSISRGVTLMLP
ncbi:hypothetical protein D3C72_2459450 [compost metagenome]